MTSSGSHQPDDIPAPDAQPHREEAPDERTSDWLEAQALRKSQLLNDQLENLLEQRKAYANKLFWLLCGWLVLVVGVVLLLAWRIKGFYLSDQVVIALLTSTTVTVVGLFLVVAKFLFPGGGTPAD